MLLCMQIERDRRDLQAYAVSYFNDPEETELSTCAEFAGTHLLSHVPGVLSFFDGSDTDFGELIWHADDFMSEYSKTFKGEKGEAEAYCYFFREEGNLDSLRQVFRVVFRTLHFLAPVWCYCLVGDLVCDMRER